MFKVDKPQLTKVDKVWRLAHRRLVEWQKCPAYIRKVIGSNPISPTNRVANLYTGSVWGLGASVRPYICVQYIKDVMPANETNLFNILGL